MNIVGFLTLDIVIILVIFIALMVVSFRSGTKFVTQGILTFYIATYIHTHFPQLQNPQPAVYIIGYIIVFALVFFILKHVSRGRKSDETKHRLWESLLLALAGTVLILTLNYVILPVQTLYDFTIPFEEFFTGKIPFNLLLIIPLLLMYVTHLRRH